MWICVDGRVLQDHKYGGVQEYTRQLLAALLRLDKQNKYLIFYNSFGRRSRAPTINAPNIYEIYFGFPNKIFNFSLAAGLGPELDSLVESAASKQFGEKIKIDIFWAPNLNFFNLRPQTKFLLTVHDLSFFIEPSFFKIKERLWHGLIRPSRLLRRGERLFPVSESTKADCVRQGISFDKCAVIYPGVESRFFDVSPDQAQRIKQKYNLPDRFALTLAAAGKRKNFESIMRVAESLGDVEFVIAGIGTEKFQKKIINNNVRALGAVLPAELPALYRAAEIFVYPSFYEGFGLPVLEAMAAGVPVVTSSCTSLPAVARDAAILIDPHDLNELRTAIIKLWNLSSLREDLSRRGMEIAKNFSWEASARKLLEKFENIKNPRAQSGNL